MPKEYIIDGRRTLVAQRNDETWGFIFISKDGRLANFGAAVYSSKEEADIALDKHAEYLGLREETKYRENKAATDKAIYMQAMKGNRLA